MKAIKRISAMFLALAVVVIALTVSAQTVQAADYHTVTFLYGTKAYSTVVAHGGYAIAPVDTYVEGYTFAGWVGNIVNVTEDSIILGAYAKNAPAAVTGNPDAVHTVDFVDGLTGKTYYSQDVKNGGGATPTLPPSHIGYAFVGYDGEFNIVTSSRTITALYEPIGTIHSWTDEITVFGHKHTVRVYGQVLGDVQKTQEVPEEVKDYEAAKAAALKAEYEQRVAAEEYAKAQFFLGK